MNKQLQKAYKACEQIIKNNSITFYAAFSNLSKEDAQAVYAIYAFCRIADDYADETFDRDALKKMQQELSFFKSGEMTLQTDYWIALKDVFERYEMEITPFEEMLAGQLKYLNVTEIISEQDLWEYCYVVAGTVGKMLLPVITTSVNEKAIMLATKLGEAMQLTNILRDLKEDVAIKRYYLPELKERIQDGKKLTKLIEYYVQDAFEKYHQVRVNLNIFKAEARFPILLALYYYRGILEKIAENNFEIPQTRIYVNTDEKRTLFLKAKRELL